MTTTMRVLRWAGYGLVALPVSICPTPVRAGAARRLLGEQLQVRKPEVDRLGLHTVLSAAIGLLTWFVAFLLVVGTVRGLFYPLVADHDLQHSWGGPTLAGAWAMHAILAVLGWAIIAFLLAGLGAVQYGMTQRLLARTGPWWPMLLAPVLAVGGVVFFIAWLHQA